MYMVTIYNQGSATSIHGEKNRLSSAKVVKGINSIDSFSFSILPSNLGYNRLREFSTIVNVFNLEKKRSEFDGRVLYITDGMSESGIISKNATCESFLGFLLDSIQSYVAPRNWTPLELLTHIVNVHNSQVEEYKRFHIGEVSVSNSNNNLYVGIQRKKSWETLNEKLIDKLGGEIKFRVVEGEIYLDYLTEIGETKSTPIALSKNMKAITREKDPSEYVTRLFPYGCKLKVEQIDEIGNVTEIETEERLDISEVNNGVPYIDDVEAIEQFGVHCDVIELDDVTTPELLKTKGEKWLVENNKILVKYSITALDLSLLGLVIDDFEVHNRHPIQNKLIGIDDTARIIKKTINICDEINSSIEVGENFKTLSDIQIEQAANIREATASVAKIESDYVTNQQFFSERNHINSLISQTAENIMLSVSEGYVNQSENEELRHAIETEFSVLRDEILMSFTETNEQILNGQTKFEEIYKYIRFAGGSITLGASDNLITLTIDNKMIMFCYNGVTLGSWDGNNFYTGNIVIRLEERLQVGDFARLPRSDGSVMLVKVGG